MRVPFKTETDAFRVTAALGLNTAAAIIVGWLASFPYGVVLFAAGIAAGLTFEFAGRDPGAGSALREAAHGPHPHGAATGTRHILVVAGEKLGGDELRRELAGDGASVEVDVLAPILASRSHQWASDIDREREQARERLEASLAWAAEPPISHDPIRPASQRLRMHFARSPGSVCQANRRCARRRTTR